VAALAYHIYRCARTDNREAHIDAIMSTIRAEHANTHLDAASAQNSLTEDQGLGRKLKKRFWFIANKNDGFLSKTYEKVQRYLDIRIAVPALSILLLSIVLIPRFSGDSLPVNNLPLSLIESASLTADLIDANTAQSMGFATGVSDEKDAFRQGVLATDISLAVAGQHSSAIDSYERQISSLAGDREIESFESYLRSARQLGQQSEIVGRSDGVNTVVSADVLDALQDLRLSLKSGQSDTENLWFDLGISVEAVAVGAKLQQEKNVIEPLRDALSSYRSIQIPEQTLPASRLLQELQQLAENHDAIDHNLHQIAAVCRDIKALMQ
jgi:hypothetical protein